MFKTISQKTKRTNISWDLKRSDVKKGPRVISMTMAVPFHHQQEETASFLDIL